jgi:perosamine synthetase
MRRLIPVSEPNIKGKELDYVKDCITSNWISSIGKYVTKFEEMFASFCKTKYALATSNGTSALHLALLSLGVGKGDEVITPNLTFVASANAVTYCGARPVFVDVDPVTWTIDPAKIEKKITKRTKAIMVVHLYGHPCDMDSILKIARENKLKIIEDAAEAHGAEYKGTRVGNLGDIAAFSFYGNKIITTGEGGMVTTNNKRLYERMKLLRDHAMSSKRRYWHTMVGYNYRMTNIQAAIGVAQTERIEEFIKIKRRNAELYRELLNNINGITLPVEAKDCKHVYWMYGILIDKEFGMTRDKVISRLKERGIDARPFFYPMHRLPMYRIKEDFPVSNELSRKGINLPSATTLAKKDIRIICEVILSIKTGIF